MLQYSKNYASPLQEELERLAAAGASQEEQDQILAAHQRELQNLVNKMDADKLRMQSNLQDKLKKRREEKVKAREAEVSSVLTYSLGLWKVL